MIFALIQDKSPQVHRTIKTAATTVGNDREKNLCNVKTGPRQQRRQMLQRNGNEIKLQSSFNRPRIIPHHSPASTETIFFPCCRN
jgi:hypothetical protein